MKYLSSVTTLQYSPGKCKGCGRCAEVCPHGVFVMAGKKAAITEKDLCMECGACMKNCEHGAIAVTAGVGCAVAMINGLVSGNAPSCGCSESKESSCC